jgi:hypothetical protein
MSSNKPNKKPKNMTKGKKKKVVKKVGLNPQGLLKKLLMRNKKFKKLMDALN